VRLTLHTIVSRVVHRSIDFASEISQRHLLEYEQGFVEIGAEIAICLHTPHVRRKLAFGLPIRFGDQRIKEL